MTTGNLHDLAARPDMPSEPTLRYFIRAHADFPLIERGRKGQTYLIDLDEAAAFVAARWHDARRFNQRARAAGKSMQPTLPFFDEVKHD